MPKETVTLLTLLEYLLELKAKGIPMKDIPVLMIETVNDRHYVSQVDNIQLITDVQELPDNFNVELNTKVDVGVFIGNFPSID